MKHKPPLTRPFSGLALSMRKSLRTPLLASALALGLGATACTEHDAHNEDAELRARVEDERRREGNLDWNLVVDISRMRHHCAFDDDGCTVSDCENGEVEAFKSRFGPDGDKTKAAAIDTWAAALGSDKPESRAVGASVMGPLLRNLGDDAKVTPTSAKRVVDALPKLTNCQAAQSIEAMTQVAVLGGQLDALINAATAHEYKDVLLPSIHDNAARDGSAR